MDASNGAGIEQQGQFHPERYKPTDVPHQYDVTRNLQGYVSVILASQFPRMGNVVCLAEDC